MKYSKMMAAMLLAAALAVPGQFAMAQEAAGTAALAEAAPQQGRLYESQGLKVMIPEAYDGLLVKDTAPGEAGRFLAVSEKASVEAAQKEGGEAAGAGWIFSLGRVTEAELHQMLCHDMLGAELIAKDQEGHYYIYYHPTDVRYVRENQEAMVRDQAQWTKLNAWAWDYAHDGFIKDNGLEPLTADNSNIGIYLANFLYGSGEAYTLCKNDEAPVLADGFSPLAYGEKLLYGVSYKSARNNPQIKFKYYTLVLPRERVRLDFFIGKDKENYVQEVHEGWTNYLYHATFQDKEMKVTAVMAKWLEDLKAYHEKMGKAGTLESVGEWDIR